ncbi:MAG TPA: hypothetical protein VFP91_07235 [Vicinamibacterales bacterium]|nr:hypothetical protein [Vicinamibacterales bacterium]
MKLVYSPIAPPTPGAGDGCWHRFDAPVPGIAPAAVIDVVGYPFRLGFFASPLYVRLWVRDDAGQVSASAVRRADYDPGIPPSVDNVFATASNAPCSPLAVSDSTVPSDEAVVIKWLANFPNGEAAAGGIDLYYTEDGVTYAPIPGAQNLTNAAGGGCTLAPLGGNASCPAGPFESSPKSGCYRWQAGEPKPTGYFGVRVRATDSKGISGVREAVPPLNAYDNASGIRFLAGNPDPGLGGNALTTVINNRLDRRYGFVDIGALAVSSRGVVYVRDRDNGILWINPQSGVLDRLGTLGALSEGDGGAAANAVWRSPQYIAVDFADRLLVWDNDRIRRVDVNSEGLPTTVDTFMGGGSDTSNSGIAPLDVQLVPNCTVCDILPMPNGDVFTTDNAFYRRSIAGHIRRYRAASNTVDTFDVTGIGYSEEPTRNLDDCAFSGLMLEQDVAAGTVVHLHAKTQPSVYGSVCNYGTATFDENGAAAALQLPNNVFIPFATVYRSGLDGKLYAWDSAIGGGIYRFDRASNQWVRVLGDGTRGINPCPDGTEAALCEAEVNDFFVDTSGNLHFISLGQLRVAVTALESDGSGGLIEKRRVRTLVGQGLYYGDGGDALSARFSLITSAKPWIDGSQEKIVVHDLVNARMREISIGGTVATIAGNGTVGYPTRDVDATTTPIATTYLTRMGVEPTSGRLHATVGYAEILYLERTGGTWMWRHLAGQGTVPYASAADGETSVQLRGTEFFALTPTSVLYVAYTLDSALFPATGGWGDGFILGFDKTTGAMSHFIGQPGGDVGFCTDGTLRANCGIDATVYSPNTDPSLDSGGPGDSDDRYVMAESNSIFSTVLRTVPANVPLAAVGTLTALPTGNFSSFAYVRRADLAGAEVVYYCPPDGIMHRKELSPTQVDVALPWPVPGVRCTGNSLVWNEARHSLTFAYKRWGLYGVAEYVDVP